MIDRQSALIISIAVGLVVLVGFLRGIAAGKGGNPRDRTRTISPKTFWAYQGIYGTIAAVFFMIFLFSK